MRVQFTFKHMASSQALMDITEIKLANLTKRFKPSPQHAKVTFSTDGRFVRMHVSLIASDGFDLEADLTGENAYALVDQVVQKLDGQLRRRKERIKRHKHTNESLRNTAKSHSELYAFRETFEPSRDSDILKSSSFWSQPPIDAGDILMLSPHHRGPLEPVCAS